MYADMDRPRLRPDKNRLEDKKEQDTAARRHVMHSLHAHVAVRRQHLERYEMDAVWLL